MVDSSMSIDKRMFTTGPEAELVTEACQVAAKPSEYELLGGCLNLYTHCEALGATTLIMPGVPPACHHADLAILGAGAYLLSMQDP
jgi:hypothetical protein